MFHHFINVYNVDWHCVKILKQSQHSSPLNPFLLCLANQILKSNKRQHIAFELWCWRRLLRVPWTVRRSNKSILKEINPEYSLEGLMLNLKLQYFVHLMQRADSLQRPWYWERLKAGGKRTTEGKMVRWHDWLNGHEFQHLWEMVKDREAWCVHGVAKIQIRLRDWTTAT